MNNAESPQYAAFAWLSQDPALPDYSPERRIQRYAMATVYFSLGGSSWLRSDGWLSNQEECDWYSRINLGVCRRNRRRLAGKGGIHSLRRLVLYYNNLQGVLPPEIGLLTDLEEIHLMGGPEHVISGGLPSELGNLVSLKEVHLANNNFTGAIPESFGDWSQLEFLDMSKNFLEGQLSDDLVGGWGKINELNLSSNIFTGPLPITLPPSLEFLDLDQNLLTGPVPPSVGILQDLRLLSLDDNSFTSLPTSIISLQSLEELSVVGNKLQGPILSELGFLSHLRSLRLAHNSLNHTIPTELGELRKLSTILDLSYNDLTGRIPVELGDIHHQLRNLSLAGNRLSGSIPASLAYLDRLSEVHLEDNDLTGSVPDSLCHIWSRTLPRAFVDCAEVTCTCCNYCCTEAQGCLCRHANDSELAWRCV